MPHDGVEQRVGDLTFGACRLADHRVVGAQDHQPVVRRLETLVPAHLVDGQEVDALAATLGDGAAQQLVAGGGLRREGDDQLPGAAAGGEAGDDVLVLHQGQHRRGARLLGELSLGGFGHPVVGDGGRHDHDIGRPRQLSHHGRQLGGRPGGARLDPGPLGGAEHVRVDVAGRQVHPRAALGRRHRQRHPLPAAGPVAEVADGIDRLAGPSGRHRDGEPREILPVGDDPPRRRVDLVGFAHPARTRVAAGERSVCRPDHVHAPGPERDHVRHRRRVLPHLGVHRWRDEHRCAGGEQGGAEQVGGEAGRHRRDRVGGGRRHHDQVGSLAERHVPHLGHVVVDGGGDPVAGDGLPGGKADEPQSILGGDDVHLVPVEDEQADELDGLVGGDAARDSHDDDHAHDSSRAVRVARVRRPGAGTVAACALW